MNKFYRGKVIKTDHGSIQFVRNNERKKDFILITGRHGDIYIPTKALHEALEDEWVADTIDRGDRK